MDLSNGDSHICFRLDPANQNLKTKQVFLFWCVLSHTSYFPFLSFILTLSLRDIQKLWIVAHRCLVLSCTES